jgi:hypothetical protein
MNKKIATVLMTLATAYGIAQEVPSAIEPVAPLPVELKSAPKMAARNPSYGYVRMGISDPDAINKVEALPGLGLGYRFAVPSASVDVSANYTRQLGTENYFYTVPKVSYLRYATPAKEQSFYYGAGLAWGGLKRGEETSFEGLVPSATIGYELNRNATWRSFVQLDVSQPTVKTIAWNEYSVDNLPAPIAEASFGLGF